MNLQDLKKQAVSTFLQGGLMASVQKKEDFSLSEELKKSKKNRHPALYFTVFGFIGFLVLFTYGANLYVENKNRQVKLSIEDFEDVNLTEMINMAKKNEEELNRVKMELEESKRNMELQIKEVRERTEKERQHIMARNLPDKQKKKLLADLKKREAVAIRQIEAKYQQEIDEKQKKVVIVKERIVNYDKKLQESLKKSEKMLQETIKKNESVVNETRKIYEIGLTRQKNFYETKIASLTTRYEKENENLKDEIKKLSALINQSEKENKNLKDKNQQMDQNNQQLSKNIQDLDQNLKSKESVLESTQKDLSQNQKDNESLKQENKTLKDLLEKTNAALALNRESLQKYIKSLDLVAKKRRDHGYILDSSNPKNIIVVLNNVYSVKSGDSALVFDESNQYVATLKFLPEQSQGLEIGIYAEVVDIASNKTIEPFYKIMIKYKTEKKK